MSVGPIILGIYFDLCDYSFRYQKLTFVFLHNNLRLLSNGRRDNNKKSLKIINFLTKSGFVSSPYSRYPLTRREIYRRHFEWYKT